MEAWREPLQAAQAHRRQQVRLKARLRAGDITLEEALADPWLRNLATTTVVAWLPGYSDERADALLIWLRIWPHKPCGRLTARQRRQLGELV